MAVVRKNNLVSNDKFVYDQDEICKMMEDYHNGINCTKTMEFMVNSLEGLIKQKAIFFRNDKNTLEDMLQTARLEIITRLADYEPMKDGKFVNPSTYFINWIVGSLRAEKTDEHKTGHYLKVFKEVKDACAKYEIPLEPTEQNIDKISKIIKRNPKSIRKAFECMSIKVSSIDNMQYEDNEFAQSPEEVFAKKEMHEMFKRAFNLLTDLQKYIFVESRLKERSYEDIMKSINNNLSAFELFKPIRISNVEKIAEDALYILQNSELKNSNLLKRTPFYSIPVEDNRMQELEMEDLETGFTFGVFDNVYDDEEENDNASSVLVRISPEEVDIKTKNVNTHISFSKFA